MKKSCLDCKALNNRVCSLGYKIETYDIVNIPCGIRPLEDCPKPRTIKEFINLHNRKKI